MNHKEGKHFTSRVERQNSKVISQSSEHEGTGLIAQTINVEGLNYIDFTKGRTISISSFEYAKFDVGLRVYIPELTMDYDQVYDCVSEYVEQFIAMELANLDDREHDFQVTKHAKKIIDRCVGKCITLSYALTLKGDEKYSSISSRIGRSNYVSDGSDILKAYKDTSEIVARFIESEMS